MLHSCLVNRLRRTIFLCVKLSCCLFFLLFAVPLAAQTSKGNIYAVCVGISQYSNPAHNLPCPRQDGVDMYNLLKQHTSSDKVILLTDRLATRENILNAVERLFYRAAPGDIVLLFFSGHGYRGGLVAHDGFLDYGELKRVLKKTKAARKLIFVDACLSGGLRTPAGATKPANFLNAGNQKVCLFLSSRTHQNSYESSSLRNGYFTYFLLAGLRGGADPDRDKIITARELFDFVNPKVRQYSRGDQVPVMWGKFENGMAILNWNK